MKIKHIINAVLVFCLLASSSCSDYLDKMPDDQKTMDIVWKSQKETEAYLYNVYSQLPDDINIYSGSPWVGAADELDVVWERYQTASINVGNWAPTNVYHNPWPDFYQSIRASFVFENNVDKSFQLTESLKKQYKAEVKFLRGYYYWRLLRQYGPFVLIDKETTFDDDWNKYPRTPYDRCVEYICQMMDEASADLPFTWKSSPKWLGKPDQVACKAVKSQVLLMAASPQWNGNPDYASFKNPDGTPLTSTTYSEDKWRQAAAAAKAVIDAAASSPAGQEIRLYKNNENGDATFNPYKSVRDVHLAKWNCEVLWGTARGENRDISELERHMTPRPGGWNGLGPTQRIVDAFFMNNGRTIEDPASSYQETGFAQSAHPNWKRDNVDEVRSGNSWGNRVGEWNMYANREARFYASIVYNGRPLPQVSNDDRNVYSSNKNKNGWGRVELYSSGVSGSGSTDHSSTGYLMLKFTHPDSNPYRDQFGSWRQHTYIRLAEIYLNYIEALNEYDPGNPDIQKYWDLIRERAGLPSIFDTYPDIKGNKAKQLEYIIRERQVELCFEGDRYFTTRRRLLSDKVDTQRPEERRLYGDNGGMYGMNVLAGDDFSSANFYNRTRFETRVFMKKMYLWPIPQSELDRNKSMVQNPGW
ncbi:RagB/SusD family nutrient uptake outer membrane protein [Pararcticibacter amylolyticus]|uniref:RagB/SusD family nutrient uptake outer membrane protein n=1 Tax=Pararcticibacter amylolyticus TaxID=2173175 RepID=A0A2U2PH25_9SPHI|nr:RagB/SusD family nutrient uptake outer membrane protein [Pararcticibacter amylolyticus]PWG80718.1 RagB/SusD family nutrient uptake outer membrane protein [Pararcticibacter amylolyticus]